MNASAVPTPLRAVVDHFSDQLVQKAMIQGENPPYQD